MRVAAAVLSLCLVGTQALAAPHSVAQPVVPEPRVPRVDVSRLVVVKPKARKRRRSHQVTRAETRTPICTATADEQWIIQRESGGDVHSWNPVNTSTGHAFGVGQLTDYQRYRFGRRLGINPNSTRFCDQLRLMRAYIADRYGNAGNAVAHWRLVGSY